VAVDRISVDPQRMGGVERDDVLAALEYAAAVVDEREVPVARPA